MLREKEVIRTERQSMKTKTFARWLVLASWLNSGTALFSQTTAFTYQGKLSDNGAPVTGLYDMRFAVYSAAAAGTLVAGPLPANTLGVTNGLFAARIDFGAGVFTGPARWLEVSVRPAGNGNFQTLSPRQELTSSPYSIRAQTAGTATDVSNGSVVNSINALKDNVILEGSANVTLTPNGNTIVIDAPGGGGGDGPWLLNGNRAYYNVGNVGIGTNGPAERLTIAGVPTYNTGLKLTGNTDAGTGLAL